MRTGLAALALVLGGLAAALPSPAFSARWDEPQFLTGHEGLPAPTLAAAAGGGTALVAYRVSEDGRTVLQVRERGPNGFGDALAVASEDGHVDHAELSAAPTGVAALSWSVSGTKPDATPRRRWRVALRRADGTWSAAADIDTGDDAPQALTQVVDAAGDVTFVWQARGGGGLRLRSRTLRADGTLGPIETLSDSAASPRPDVAVTPAGAVAVAWVDVAGGTRAVHVARRPAGADRFSPQQVAPGEVVARTRPAVALDDAGGALIGFIAPARGGARASAVRQTADGEFGRVRVLSPARAYDVAVAVNARGDAIAAWRHGSYRRCRVQAAHAPRGRRFGPARTLSPGGSWGCEPAVAIDARGVGTAVWRRTVRGRYTVEIESARISAARAGRVMTVMPRVRGTAIAPAVVGVGDGELLATWTLRDRAMAAAYE